MKIFVTGATGYLGSAVVAELLGAGHEVVGLTSSEGKVAALEAAGVRPVVGDIGDPGTYRSEAARAEGSVHCAVEYGAETVAKDGAAIETLLSAAGEGASRRPMVYTSGVWVLGDTGDTPADETVEPSSPADAVTWRPAHERMALGGGSGVASSVIRPGVIYGGDGSHPDILMDLFFESAESRGASEYLGDGANRMALVHLADVARLYRLAVEAGATGIFHAVDDHPIPMIEVARLASRAAGAGGEVRSVPLAEARKELGPVADALALDQVVASRRSREELGWRPHLTSYREGVEVAYRERGEGAR